MSIKFYNTLSRKKEEFKPINEEEVRMYSCGPTVYYYAHIGNLRAYLFMDNLRRVLKYNGYKLKHVMNITDVGHLVSDADDGEDKMMKAARRENKNPYEIAQYYMDAFLKDIDTLNIDRPEIIARATEHIDVMEEYVKKIIENGYTYQTEDTVYFDTSKVKYGMLSNRNVEDQKAGARVEFDKNKKNISDFAVWIKAPENHIMQWNSFFGKAYPGWHLECSAMGYKYLGDHFDIHTGGVDHIPIHHENEIAQSLGFSGKVPANYWMHCEFLQINGGKMSKSLNNLYTLKDLDEKGYEPLVYRMFNYTSNYRAQINFTFEAMDAAKTSLTRLRDGYLKHKESENIEIDQDIINDYKNRFLEAINDDLNMPVAMSVVWEVVKNPNKSKKFAELLLKFDEVLGFDLDSYVKIVNDLPEEIIALINQRNDARLNKNWSESDRIRDILIEKGYTVKDSKEGTIVE